MASVYEYPNQNRPAVVPLKRLVLRAELVRNEFHPVEADCLQWAAVINAEVFKGAIDLSLVTYLIPNRMPKDTWAEVRGYKGSRHSQVVMSKRFPSKEVFLNVLAHELIHVLQCQNGEPEGHGASFWKWDAAFKRNGLVLMLKLGEHGEKLLRKLANRKGK